MNPVRVITVPQMGEGEVEVVITRLYKSPGDVVAVDESMYEMETAKATVDIESALAGTVGRWLGAEGDTVAIGSPVVEIAPSGTVSPPGQPLGDDAANTAATTDQPGQTVPSSAVLIPPRTRAYAQQLGIDPAELQQIRCSNQ